ncbi:MAG: HAD family hydrolase [Prolixibacteraceae bacterium]|nr:HAD family hydrolase [Prolixibacteraceae bacterium]MBN2649132.1 HAD family hydrolase [Prolixibacteraceae bacterium]
MPDINTILWDWNGTLLNDVEVSIESINELLFRRNLPTLSVEKYRDVFGFPVKDYYRRIGFDFRKEPFEIPAKEYIDTYQKNFSKASLQKNAAQLLEYYRVKGYSQVVLSASEINNLHIQLLEHSVAHFFNEIAGLSDIYASSKAELGIRTLEKLGINPENACLIGDTTHDFEVAQQIGCRCILIHGGHHSIKKLNETGVPVVSEINEVKKLLV